MPRLRPERDVGHAVEAPPKAADQVDHRVGERDGLPQRRQHVDRIEAAAQEGERRDDQQRHHLQLLEAVGPDADDEAEHAEGGRRQHQEQHHPQRMLDAQRHEQPRGGHDDEPEDDRLGGRRADVGEHDLQRRHRCRQQLVDGAGELGEVDAERGVGDALRQQRQHHQPGHDEGAVADAAHLRDARADRRAEHDEIQRRRDHRRDDALHQRAPGARHLEAVDRAHRVPVHRRGCVRVRRIGARCHSAVGWPGRCHAWSFSRPTKMSSSELSVVFRSLKPMPRRPSSAISAAMSARPLCASKV